MATNLEKAYQTIAQIVQAEVKDKIKSGPTKAYRTGDLYRSISTMIKSVAEGESISLSMNYYGQYVNDGTRYIEPPRRFIEAGLKSSDQQVEEVLSDAGVKDIEQIIDTTFND